ncbi:MAG: DUF697 domain-containing protein [Pseudomonadota bacterium]
MATIDSGENQEDGHELVEWDLASQWKETWRILKWAATALVVIAFLTVIGQAFLYYRMFDDMHPLLGIAFAISLAGLLAFLIGRPLLSFFMTPVMARPPDVPIDLASPDPAALTTRLKFDRRYLKALARNPELSTVVPQISADLAHVEQMLDQIPSADREELSRLAAAVQTLEQTNIQDHLNDLDAKVDKLIHREAVGVGVATAISMNGTIDAFIVLWRNVNLVARISRLYFGRPHLRGSLLILRDVAAIVVASRVMEDVTESTGEIVGGLLGRMGGLVAGPLMDGAVNGVMTLKLGFLAKRRCRSFEAWTNDRAVSITRDVLEKVRRESFSVITDILSRTNGLVASATRATERAMSGSKAAWNLVMSWFGGGAAKAS